MTRRNDEAQAFDEAWERHAAGRSLGPTSVEVAELVRAAELLCATADAQPRETFRVDLRERLMAEAATVLVAAPAADRAPVTRRPERSHPARRRLAGLAAAAVAALGGVGLVTSSASAVPGDTLYSVKRGVENVELSLRRGPESQGAYQLERATERLREAKVLAREGDPTSEQRVADVLDDFSTQADAGSEELLDVYSTDGSDRAVSTLGAFTTSAAQDLTSLDAALEGSTVDPLERAKDTVRDLAKQVSSICGSCTDIASLAAVTTPQTVGRPDPQPTQPAAKTKASAPKSSGSTSTPRSPSSTSPLPSIVPTLPKPSTSTKPPTLGDVVGGVTDPLLGGLLGNEKQKGLVPGLLGGLTGK
ncbi:MAG: DUF5667 domain-containing protein [Aeromicrobium erythreum]